MAEPLSEDLRRHLIVEAGASRPAVAERFGVVSSTVTKLVQRLKRTGSLAPAPQGGDRRSARMEMHAEEILALVAASPDITLEEIAAHLKQAHSETFVVSTIWRCLDPHGLTFKKKGRTPASRSAPTWWRPGTRGAPRSLTSIRPGWSSSTKPASRPRWRVFAGGRGVRCVAAVPHGHWKTTTLVGGLRLSGTTAP